MNIQLDDGVQFGLGVFETICLRKGRPEFLEWHLERINGSLTSFGIPQQVTIEEVQEWLSEESKDEPIEDLAALKIMVSDKNKHFLIRHNPYTEEVIEKGFILDYSSVLRNETSPLVYHKTMNYGDNILEKRATKQRGIDEVIFLNSKGAVTEGSTTNIFFVKEGHILTPHHSCGLLPGVMRRFVMEQVQVEEKVIEPDDIAHMEECFVTNSLMGIMTVNTIGNHSFKNDAITRQLQELYRSRRNI
ncbi:MAG: aminotransferase class IV [Lachnospiraceae bacterium]|nr:aminotransferase class IV [Lachnospiraceae bacterium]